MKISDKAHKRSGNISSKQTFLAPNAFKCDNMYVDKRLDKSLAWILSARISSPYISAARPLATAPVSLRPSEATIYPDINAT